MSVHRLPVQDYGNHIAKDGRKFSIRSPDVDDADNIVICSRILFASTDQVLTLPEEYNISAEYQRNWIANINQSPSSLLLVAEMGNQIIGLLFFVQNEKFKNSHTGEFGVSVLPECQGTGIGLQLIITLLDWARTNRVIEKVYLKVFATNHVAIKLYRGLGFIEEGRHIKAVKQLNGDYVDVYNCISRHMIKLHPEQL